MAFDKAVPTPFNVDARYHKITSVMIDFLKSEAVVVVSGWRNRADRDSGIKPLTSESTTIAGNDFSFSGGEPSRAELYAKLRSMVRTVEAPLGRVTQPSRWSDAAED